MAQKTPNPFDEFDAPAANPFDEFDTAPPAPKEPEGGGFMEGLGRMAAVATNALSPYATAATLGAAAGAPFAGVGAIPGAAGGVLSLGLGDLGTTLYNAAAPSFGRPRMPLPSETIRRGYQSVGIGKEPVTPSERLLSAGIEGTAGALSGSGAANQFASLVRDPTTRKVLTTLAQQPKAQAMAGAGSALAGQGAAELGLGPTAQLAASFAGGVAGGYAGAQRPTKVTEAALEKIKTDAYAASKSAGVNVSARGMDDLERQIDDFLSQVEYRPSVHPLVAEARKKFTDEAGKDMSFELLEKFRQSVRDLPYSQAGGKRGTSYERALVGRMSDAINDFMLNLTPTQTTAGNVADAAQYLSIAKDAARRNFQAEVGEIALRRSLKKDSGSAAANIRKGFDKIAENKNRMDRLDPKLQADIKALGEGKGFRAFERAGKFAPNINLQNLGGLTTSGAGLSYLGQPGLAGLGAVLGGGAIISKAAANQKAKSLANAMINRARGTPDFKLPKAGIGMATATQAPLGQVLLGYGIGPSGESVALYGDPSKNSNTMPRR
jgi:hypothetical protein